MTKQRRKRARKRNLVAKRLYEQRNLRERTEPDRRAKLLEKAQRKDRDYA